MDAKFVIFVSVSAILIAAVYSSSVFIVFAETITYCSYNKSKTKASCSNIDDSGPSTEVTNWSCTKNKSGTWSCTEAASQPPTPDLQNAITGAKSRASAAGAATEGGNNNTSVFNGGVVKGGAVFKGGAAIEGNNTSTNSNNTLQ